MKIIVPILSGSRKTRWLIAGLMLGVVILAAVPGPAAPTEVISLKSFIECKYWQLDITWSARDSFEDKDYRGEVETTGTARYILKQLDRQDAWGHWQALKEVSANLSYRGFLLNKHNGKRTDYKQKGGPLVVAVADFQVGGMTPGYMLTCQATYPAEMRDADAGIMDCPITMAACEMETPPPQGVLNGPLPESGTTIHGSRVFLRPIPPFVGSTPGYTRVGVTFVLRPSPAGKPLPEASPEPQDPLAPLTPDKPQDPLAPLTPEDKH